MADVPAALANLERAFVFWKTFQKLAPEAGLEASSPREALMAGLKMHFVTPAESHLWAQMLRDRDLTSHTYNECVADELVERLVRDCAAPRLHLPSVPRGETPPLRLPHAARQARSGRRLLRGIASGTGYGRRKGWDPGVRSGFSRNAEQRAVVLRSTDTQTRARRARWAQRY